MSRKKLFISISGKPEEKENVEIPKISDNVMPDQNSPLEMPVDETSESTEDQIMPDKLVEIQANNKEETD
mgnify:CR=1 FL=1